MATPKQRQAVVENWLKAEGLYEEFVENVLNSGTIKPGDGINEFFRHYLGHIRQCMWPDYVNILVWSFPEKDEERFEKWKKVNEKWKKYVDEKGLMRDWKYY